MGGERLSGGPDPEEEIDQEIRFHLEERARSLEARGRTPEEARAEALRRFGDPDAARRAAATEDRRARRGRIFRGGLESVARDVARALRALRRAPGFALVVILTVGLTLGATTALFSVVDGIMLRPLPFPEPERMVAVWADHSAAGGPEREWHSYPNLHDIRENASTLEAVGWYLQGTQTLTGDGVDPVRFSVGIVDQQLLAGVLRATPLLGRLFLPEEDRPGADGTTVLSHRTWQTHFGGDPAVVGSTIRMNDLPFTVIGVMPPDFRPPFATTAELWVPLRMDVTDHMGGRGAAVYRSIARVREGVGIPAAASELARLGAALEAEHPRSNTGVTFSAIPLRDDVVGQSRQALLVLLASAGLVLLLGCINVANLLLARGTTRGGELGLRTALGAGRGRLLGQLVAEHGTLVVLGGVLGVALALLGTELLVSLAPAGIPRLDEVGVDRRVLAFAAAATLLAAILSGVWPAVRLVASGAPAGLARGTGTASVTRSALRARSLLVTGQVATAVVLLVGAGLLSRSYQKLQEVPLGFETAGVLTFELSLPAARYPDRARLRAVTASLQEELAAVPGVGVVGIASGLPLDGRATDTNFLVEGEPTPEPGSIPATWYRQVTPGFFEALGVTPVAGRLPTAMDDAMSPRVVVISEAFVRRHFPGEDPVGRRLNFGSPEDPAWATVIGVVADLRGYGIRDDAVLVESFIPLEQQPSSALAFALRVQPGVSDPEGVLSSVRAAVAAVDPALAVARPGSLDRLVAAALATDRFVMSLVGLFAAVALLLASVGLYGVVSYGVGTRRREMGVRMALGARGGNVVGLVLRGSLSWVAAGLVAGCLAAALLTRLLRGLLFGVEPTDPVTFLAVPSLLALVALLAALGPARRAALTDPVQVLREE